MSNYESPFLRKSLLVPDFTVGIGLVGLSFYI